MINVKNLFQGGVVRTVAWSLIAGLAVACLGLTIQKKLSKNMDHRDVRIVELETQLKAIHDREEAEARLGQYAVNMMFKSPNTVKNLSPARMLTLAQAIVRVSSDIFDNDEQKHSFIAALQIESQFIKFAQSPTGPKGLGQVARATFHYALERCGVKGANDDDVWETDLNLAAAACYYKEQIVNNNGDVFAAIVAYNQGPEAADSKTYAKYGHIDGLEPLKYVAKFGFILRNTTDKKVPGVPAISDLPKPTGKKIEQKGVKNEIKK